MSLFAPCQCANTVAELQQQLTLTCPTMQRSNLKLSYSFQLWRIARTVNYRPFSFSSPSAAAAFPLQCNRLKLRLKRLSPSICCTPGHSPSSSISFAPRASKMRCMTMTDGAACTGQRECFSPVTPPPLHSCDRASVPPVPIRFQHQA